MTDEQVLVGVEELAELRRRVDMLTQRESVRDLFHNYGAAIDYGDFDAWVDCFTDDGVFDVRLRGEQLQGPVRGRDELRRYIEKHGHIPDQWHKHMILGSRFDLQGSSADVTSYFTRLDWKPGGGPFVQSIGRYVDRLRWCPDERWRIQVRLVEVEGLAQSRDIPL